MVTAWHGTVLRLGFPAGQGDVNVLILVVGTATPRDTAEQSWCLLLQSVRQEGAALTWSWGMKSHPQGLTSRVLEVWGRVGFWFVF